jgi:hypothetical protein
MNDLMMYYSWNIFNKLWLIFDILFVILIIFYAKDLIQRELEYRKERRKHYLNLFNKNVHEKEVLG